MWGLIEKATFVHVNHNHIQMHTGTVEVLVHHLKYIFFCCTFKMGLTVGLGTHCCIPSLNKNKSLRPRGGGEISPSD